MIRKNKITPVDPAEQGNGGFLRGRDAVLPLKCKQKLCFCAAYKIAGFTLIEVMIALCILAVLSVMTLEGFHSITNNRTHINAKLTQLSQLQMASVILRRDLSQIIDRSSGSDSGSFQGSSSSLSFIRAGYVNPLGALHRSTLQSVQYGSGGGLSRTTSSVLDPTSQTTTSTTSTRVILADVSALKFEFIDPKGQLHDTWPPPEPKSDTSDNSDNSAPPKPKWPKFPSGIQVTMMLKNWGTVTFVVPVYAGDMKKIEDLAQQANSQSTTTPS